MSHQIPETKQRASLNSWMPCHFLVIMTLCHTYVIDLYISMQLIFLSLYNHHIGDERRRWSNRFGVPCGVHTPLGYPFRVLQRLSELAYKIKHYLNCTFYYYYFLSVKMPKGLNCTFYSKYVIQSSCKILAHLNIDKSVYETSNFTDIQMRWYFKGTQNNIF